MGAGGVEEATKLKEDAPEFPKVVDTGSAIGMRVPEDDVSDKAAPAADAGPEKETIVEKTSELVGKAVDAVKAALGGVSDATNGTAEPAAEGVQAEKEVDGVLELAHHAAEVATDAVDKVLQGVSNGAEEKKVEAEEVGSKGEKGLSRQLSMGKRLHNEAFGADGVEVQAGDEKRAMGGA